MVICMEIFFIFSTLLPLAASSSNRSLREESVVFRRQQNPDSVCSAYGIDFQNGGSYFINSLSDANFTCVTKFEGYQVATESLIVLCCAD